MYENFEEEMGEYGRWDRGTKENWSANQRKVRRIMRKFFDTLYSHNDGDMKEIFNKLIEMSITLGHLDENGEDTIQGGMKIQMKDSLKKLFTPDTEIEQPIPSYVDKHFDYPMTWYKSNNDFLFNSNSVQFDDKDDFINKISNGYGSLRLTSHYPKYENTHPVLDEFHDIVSNFDVDQLTLNPHLYIIPKYPTYTTGHHQDVHVPPHVTLYQHLQGASRFYFLPQLFGLFASHLTYSTDLTTVEKIEKFKQFYELVDFHNFGSFGEIKEGELLVVTPYTTHMVQVPENSDSTGTKVRAAELFVNFDEDNEVDKCAL